MPPGPAAPLRGSGPAAATVFHRKPGRVREACADGNGRAASRLRGSGEAGRRPRPYSIESPAATAKLCADGNGRSASRLRGSGEAGRRPRPYFIESLAASAKPRADGNGGARSKTGFSARIRGPAGGRRVPRRGAFQGRVFAAPIRCALCAKRLWPDGGRERFKEVSPLCAGAVFR